MKIKFTLQKINIETNEVEKEKHYNTLNQIAKDLNIDYQNTQKFYKLCNTDKPKLKGLHGLLSNLYKSYRIKNKFDIPTVNFD